MGLLLLEIEVTGSNPKLRYLCAIYSYHEYTLQISTNTVNEYAEIIEYFKLSPLLIVCNLGETMAITDAFCQVLLPMIHFIPLQILFSKFHNVEDGGSNRNSWYSGFYLEKIESGAVNC